MCELRDVVGYEGWYQVSDDGRVYSLRSGQGPRAKPRQLKSRADSHGYQSVELSLNKDVRRMRVHRLVLTAFRGPRPDGMCARHLDDNQANNHIDNLVWGTHGENVADAIKHRRYSYGVRQWAAKLTTDEVAQIIAFRGVLSQSHMARNFGVSRTTISNVLSGKSWATAR
jgi:hypothetical protein